MDLSSQMVLFAKVVEHGSFSAAARVVGHAPSALSRQVGALENRLGVRLLHRTRQGLMLTEAGAAFHARSVDVATRVAEAEAEALAMGTQPVGQLRIASTVAFGRTHLLPLLPAFLEGHSRIRVSLVLSDRQIDLAADRIDVAIRFSEQISDQSVVSRRLAPNRRIICAAPAYLRRAGTPNHAGALARHNCLRLSTVEAWNEWRFPSKTGETRIIATGDFEANSADAIYHATLAGLGIARLPAYLVAADLKQGSLVQLLPELVDEATDILAVYVDRQNLPRKIRVFIDYLADAFAGTPSWEA